MVCLLASGNFHFGRTFSIFSTETSIQIHELSVLQPLRLLISNSVHIIQFAHCSFNYLQHITENQKQLKETEYSHSFK